jgi:hypothetical protein
LPRRSGQGSPMPKTVPCWARGRATRGKET